MAAKRVLIIDDEKELQELLSITFQSRNYKIFTANDGEDGLKQAQKKKPDVIILDIKMPKLNGYEFLSRMRKDDRIKDTPVVVLTSITDESSRTETEWAESMGVDAFVSKPVEPYDLLERVERVLGAAA